ncbi:hypothetical protein GCM10020358_08500 [Amorphoplanes nipponensis]
MPTLRGLSRTTTLKHLGGTELRLAVFQSRHKRPDSYQCYGANVKDGNTQCTLLSPSRARPATLSRLSSGARALMIGCSSRAVIRQALSGACSIGACATAHVPADQGAT